MRLIAAGSLLLSVLALCVAQEREKPNFSGTWRRIESKNIAKLPGQSDLFEKTLIISHTEPEIKLTISIKDNGREKRLDTIYFSDNRGETNSTFRENETLKSKTRWSDNKLEVWSTDESSGRNPAGDITVIKLEMTERWELSKDGNTLTKTTSLSGSPGVQPKNTVGPGSPREVFARVK